MSLTRKQKTEYLDKLNENITEINTDSITRVLNKNQREAIEEANAIIKKSGKLTRKQMNKIARKFNVKAKAMQKVVFNMQLVSDVTVTIENQNLTKKQIRDRIKPLISRYPKVTAKNVAEATKGILTSLELKKKPELVHLRDYVSSKNLDIIQTATKKYAAAIKTATGQTKIDMLREYNEIVQKASVQDIPKQLKIITETTKDKISRIVGQQNREQLEEFKLKEAKRNKFNFKIWNTQKDNVVRDTHSKLQGTKIGINEEFNVGGHKAQRPQQESLPPQERFNCRCQLTFTNK